MNKIYINLKLFIYTILIPNNYTMYFTDIGIKHLREGTPQESGESQI